MLLLAVALGAATVAAYTPVFSAGFVDVDDADYVPENDVVRAGLRADGVVWAFTGTHAGNWFPLTWLSHMADVELFGLEPGGHHAMNLALHVANVLLLFALLVGMTGELAPSFLVAGVFALHPIQVESVAWISQRKTTLSTLFGLLALWGYARFARTGARWAYAGSLVAFAASLLAKQAFAGLPFALLLLDYWPLRRPELEPPPGELPTARSLARGWLRLLPDKLPYLLLTIGASVAALVAQGEAIATGATFPLSVRLGNAVLSYGRYVGTLVWPTHLAVFYPLREEDVTLLRVAVSGVLLLALTLVLCRLGRTRRQLVVGWFWFLGMLVPVVGVVQVGAQAMADRYAYVPCWGLLVAGVWTAWEAVRSPRCGAAWRPVAAGGAAALLLGLAFLTHRQAERWHDSIALFESAVAADDGNYVAHRALAAQYFNRGDYARALHHAEEGMKHPRDLGEILPIYGMALFQTGATAEAIERLQESTRVAPQKIAGFTNLAWVYLQLEKPALAVPVLTAALEHDPQSVRATQLLAQAQLRQGNLSEAAETLDRLIALAPRDFDARIERARTAVRLGRPGEAEAGLRDALEAARGFPDDRRPQLTSTLHLYLGDLLVGEGDGARGAAEYELALVDWPDSPAANSKLAKLLAESTDPAVRDPARAERLAARARALAPPPRDASSADARP